MFSPPTIHVGRHHNLTGLNLQRLSAGLLPHAFQDPTPFYPFGRRNVKETVDQHCQRATRVSCTGDIPAAALGTALLIHDETHFLLDLQIIAIVRPNHRSCTLGTRGVRILP